MSNKEDLEISSMSYTSKDFGTLYPEILDLAKQLTNKWDPSQSNESDPGVVLLKEAAFVADHNNYNIDKNILENFLPSATQDRSVRNIMEMNGYTPRYYVSATGNVTFTWENPNVTEDKTFTIPAFTLIISDADQTVSYTQIQDLSINIDASNPTKSIPSSCMFIEGTINTLTVNNSSTIQLSNLDDNNRIYLPNSMVAQNGIYIRYVNDSDHKNYGFWTRNNYLSTQPSGSRVYKLDYDSLRSLPYIEFPSDIASIINDGISISYVTTSGEAGNVSANTLVNIVSPSEFTARNESETRSTEYLTLTNSSSIINGKDPETISEMYNSFKKVVGTFDTLVSCDDYANRIYTEASDYVSNCYVTDRRTDYNKALNVVTYDSNGTYFENVSIKPCALNFTNNPTITSDGNMYTAEDDKGKLHLYVMNGGIGQIVDTINLNDFALLTQAMTPYDLVIYALKAFSITDFNVSYPAKALENSFMPISDQTRNYIESDTGDILGSSKCICHTFKDPDGDDVYCFKNYAPLTITITPFNKITTAQKKEIINNVYKELSNSFNPRNLDFGEALDKSTIKEVIINADTRIKDCDINYSYNLYSMDRNGNRKLVSSDSELLIDLIAKNILAGRVCLFEFDDNFTYDYEQSDCEILENITSISSKLPINVSKSTLTSVSNATKATSTSTIDSTGTNITYKLNALNFKDADGELKNITGGTSYTLTSSTSLGESVFDGVTKICDSFTIKCTSNNQTTTTTYRADDASKKYTISFNNQDLENTDKDEYKGLSAGTLVITTESVISSDTEDKENLHYTLKDNEYIQVIYPNYYSNNTYSLYVNYRWISSDTIKANTEYEIKSGDRLVLQYTNDGVTQTDILTAGKVIKTSFDIVPTDTLTSSGVKKSWTDDNGVYHDADVFRTLASNQTISTRILLQTVLNSSNMQCYWISDITDTIDNKKQFKLFPKHIQERILGDNEYFIYTNSNKDEIFILGSGTKIKRTDLNDDQWMISEDDMLTIESITENGISSSIAWQALDFSKTPFYITEMNVVTLESGNTISIKGWELAEDTTIDNEWQTCNADITYWTNSSDSSTKVSLPKVSDFYSIRSRLDIISGPGVVQELYDTNRDDNYPQENGIQEIVINGYVGNTPVTRYHTAHKISGDVTIELPETSNFKFQMSELLNVLGGEIDLSLYDDLNSFFYASDKNKMTGYVTLTGDGSTEKVDLNGSKAINVDRYDEVHTTQEFTYTYPFYYKNTEDWGRDYLIPIYISGNQVKINARIYSKNDEEVNDEYFWDYNSSDSAGVQSMELSGDSLYFLSPTESGEKELYLELTWKLSNAEMTSVQTIIVGDLTLTEGLNSRLSLSSAVDKNAILNRISTLLKGSDKPSIKFYYPYKPDDTMKINLDKYENYVMKLSSGDIYVKEYKQYAFDNPEVMFDVNNVANHATICQIDLANSNINIESSMME
jgi:hypothetical protein